MPIDSPPSRNESESQASRSLLSSPWFFVPALFMTFGLGSIGILGSMASIMYKDMGYPNTFIGMLSILTLPGAMIFLITPFLDTWGTKRNLIWRMMLAVAAVLLALATVSHTQVWFTPLSLLLLLVMSFLIACQGTAANGFYQRSLSLKGQAKFTGIITASIRAGGLIGLVVLVRIGADINSNGAEADLRLPRSLVAQGVGEVLMADAPLPVNGVLRKDVRFTISDAAGNEAHITLDAAASRNNQSRTDLTRQINHLLQSSALSDKVQAEHTAEGILTLRRTQPDTALLAADTALTLRITPRTTGWTFVMVAAAAVFTAVALYCRRFLPYPAADVPADYGGSFPLLTAIREYLKLKRLWAIVALLLFYRFGEGMLFAMAAPFYMDRLQDGGMGLSPSTVAMLKTYTDIPWMTIGGILGGFIISKWGLRRTFLPLGLFLNFTTLGYVYLAWAQPTGTFTLFGDTFPVQLFLISSFEGFSYGMGYAPFVFYMYAIAQGPYKTSLLMISTCIAGIGFAFPGALSGFIQHAFGYTAVFSSSMLLGLIALALLLVAPMPDIESKQPQT